jgi:hypothetical protein
VQQQVYSDGIYDLQQQQPSRARSYEGAYAGSGSVGSPFGTGGSSASWALLRPWFRCSRALQFKSTSACGRLTIPHKHLFVEHDTLGYFFISICLLWATRNLT